MSVYKNYCLKTMRPKTKLQQEVKALSDYKLPNIDSSIENWAYTNCFDKLGYRNKNSISCLECGYRWKNSESSRNVCKCPSCHSRLKVNDTLKRVLKDEICFGVIQTFERFQVNRYFLIKAEFRVGHRPSHSITEVCQQWVLPNGKYVIYSMRHKIGWSKTYWMGNFEIRANTTPYYYPRGLYNITPSAIYPKIEVLAELKKHGVNKIFQGVSPLDLMVACSTDNTAESLMKMRQESVLAYYLNSNNRYFVDRYWRSICICQRREYKIKDATMWFDYLSNLEYLQKDIRNPHYICPKDLSNAHDTTMIRVQKLRDRREQEARKLEEEVSQEAEIKYAQDKAPFIGFSLVHQDISLGVLSSVKEFRKEGETMRHCVYSNKYYAREDCLILSAKIKGEPVATIELSLETWSIIQCRGKYNSEPPQKLEIINLLEKSIPDLQKRMIG